MTFGFLVRVKEWTVAPQNNTENIDGEIRLRGK